MTSAPQSTLIDIAVRAYVCKETVPDPKPIPDDGNKPRKPRLNKPSPWSLVLDTETTTDAAQKLRFGAYQLYKHDTLMEAGFFYNPKEMSESELSLLKAHTESHSLDFMSVDQFSDKVFFYAAQKLRATIVGMNLPFDLSRLSIDSAPARTSRRSKLMQGGFSLKLSDNSRHARVQIKHVSSKQSFIQLAATKERHDSKSDRKKGRTIPFTRGYFVDVKTLGAALLSAPHSLESLANALGTASKKHVAQSHGEALTAEYLTYAMQDVQVTWECYHKLRDMYALHNLAKTPLHKIYSEASLGKAYFREMGIQPWTQLQPDFPPEILGHIMTTYYGGRSEVHIRREITRVLYCDFTSMYPTVCTNMGLWQFVTAQGITQRDSTEDTRQWLEKVSLETLQHYETWQQLTTIVQVIPEDEIYPVRAKYCGDDQYTIGSNHLKSDAPLWFTLADVVVAKLLSGKTPKIVRAIRFDPMEKQAGLRPIYVAGNEAYRVDPYEGDFFKQIIDLRMSVKEDQEKAAASEKHQFEDKQRALKILANSTSYGIFMELNVEDEKRLEPMWCYGVGNQPMPIRQKKFEAQGMYFHPLLATLITGAARLMLAIAEHLAITHGIDWALCDTDSMALAKPESMSEAEFLERAALVRQWFNPLNPYASQAELLKIEKHNYSRSAPGSIEPLYCLAISSKRYALFNLDAKGKPVLRKPSVHGLGHLRPPYENNAVRNLEGAEPWQQDLWIKIIEAELAGRGDRPDYSSMPNMDTPAIGRFAVTTPALSQWVKGYNEGKDYADHIRPFGFMFIGQSHRDIRRQKPIMPFDKDHSKALKNCVDRETGECITPRNLKTYRDALAQYHLHPEAKFLNGAHLDKGKTQRRHIVVKSIRYIGKEANKWEEQYHTGVDEEAQLEYGISADDRAAMLDIIKQAISSHGIRAVAKASRLSAKHVTNIIRGNHNPTTKTIGKLHTVALRLNKEHLATQAAITKAKQLVDSKTITLRMLAKKLGVDHSNLGRFLSGNKKFSKVVSNKLTEYIMLSDLAAQSVVQRQ